MLLENEKLDRMRERTKKLAADFKNGVPEPSFLNHMEVNASQVKNLQIRVQTRDHVVNVDQSTASGGDGTAQSPTETLLAATAACLELNWIAYSSAFDLDIKRVSVKIEGTLDQRFVLSGLEIPARLKSMKITSQLVCSEPREKIERVYKRVLQYCPVGGSLHPDIQKEYVLDVQPI